MKEQNDRQLSPEHPGAAKMRNRALVVPKAGELVQREAPELRGIGDLPAKDIRIAVKYAGVGFADVLAVAGNYPLAPRRPFSPGYEVFGTVIGTGRDVTDLAVGDRVCALLLRMGGYREVVDLAEWLAVKVPDDVKDETAAALPLNYLTALALLDHSAELKSGQSFLIHGAAGGVGSAAIQIGNLLGLRSFGTASPAKHDFVRSLGCVPIDYTSGEWLSRARQMHPAGFDAVLDSFGGKIQRESWRALNQTGTLVSYGFYSTKDQRIGGTVAGLSFVYAKTVFGGSRRAVICGLPAIVKSGSVWYRDSMKRILSWVASGEFKPIIDTVYPWYEVQHAHNAIVERKVRGKILLAFNTP